MESRCRVRERESRDMNRKLRNIDDLKNKVTRDSPGHGLRFDRRVKRRKHAFLLEFRKLVRRVSPFVYVLGEVRTVLKIQRSRSMRMAYGSFRVGNG